MNCPSNLRQVALAAKQYALDNGGAYPPDFSPLYPDYVDSSKIFSCPSNPSRWQEIQRTGRVRPKYTSYVYVSGLTSDDDPRCILAFDRPENHRGDGANAVFLDTCVEWMPLEEFKKLLDETRRLARGKGREVRLIGE